MSKIIGHIYSNPIRLKLYRDKCVKNPSLTEKLLTDVYVILRLTKFYALAANKKLSKRQLPVRPVTEILSTWLHSCFSRDVMNYFISTGQAHGCPMGLLPDTYNCGLRIRRECRERFPRHRGLAIPTCITVRAWRTCRDAYRDRLTSGFLWSRRWENVPGIPGACATRNFTYLARGPLQINYPWSTWINRSNEPTKM